MLGTVRFMAAEGANAEDLAEVAALVVGDRRGW